ncbi:MAG TPA: GDYXXLXY domain-containing protein, partial [Vicinamibacterales bacterium]
MRRALVLVGLALVLTLPNLQIRRQERLLAEGRTVLLELTTVDPRSLIQGDYMRLDYRIARDLRDVAGWPPDGSLVVHLDADGVAQFVRRHDESRPLAPGEILLRYRIRYGRLYIGTDAFHFQEGHADRYSG